MISKVFTTSYMFRNFGEECIYSPSSKALKANTVEPLLTNPPN